METIVTGYQWLRAHPELMTTATIGLYHAASAFIGSLEMPDATSSKLYGFFFRFANKFAANYTRAGVSALKDKVSDANESVNHAEGKQ